MQISWHDSCTSTISIDFTLVAKSPPVRDYYILISFSGSKKRGFKPFIGRHSLGGRCRFAESVFRKPGEMIVA